MDIRKHISHFTLLLSFSSSLGPYQSVTLSHHQHQITATPLHLSVVAPPPYTTSSATAPPPQDSEQCATTLGPIRVVRDPDPGVTQAFANL